MCAREARGGFSVIKAAMPTQREQPRPAAVRFIPNFSPAKNINWGLSHIKRKRTNKSAAYLQTVLGSHFSLANHIPAKTITLVSSLLPCRFRSSVQHFLDYTAPVEPTYKSAENFLPAVRSP